MSYIVNLYKFKGETPFQALERFRKSDVHYKKVALSYAGRLDPMAEGVLLVLVGDENKKRQQYIDLTKEYEVEILFGFETDTYDVLGMVDHPRHAAHVPPLFNQRGGWGGVLKDAVLRMIGTFTQPYPPYSSKPVKGKPLFQWAREGRIHEIEIPTKKVTIYSCDFIDLYSIPLSELREKIFSSLSLIKGDFRQKEIQESWNQVLSQFSPELKVQIAKIKVSCSSGTYMRSIAHDMGKKLGTSALALSIKRTKVGEFTSEQALQ